MLETGWRWRPYDAALASGNTSKSNPTVTK
jgi:hypothetical protein